MLTQLRRIQGRKTVSIFEEINQVDCKALEDIVFDALARISHQIPQLPYFCPRNHFAIKKLDFLSCCDSIKRN